MPKNNGIRAKGRFKAVTLALHASVLSIFVHQFGHLNKT